MRLVGGVVTGGDGGTSTSAGENVESVVDEV